MSHFETLPPFRDDESLQIMGETNQPGHFSTSFSPQNFSTSQFFNAPTGQLNARTAIPLHDIAATQSLVSALHSTLPRDTPRALVIPGTRRRTPDGAQEHAQPVIHLHPKMRQGIIWGMIVLVLLTTLLSLTPLDNGQSRFTALGAAIEWVRAQQSAWTVSSHDLALKTTNQKPSVPGLTGGAALPPVNLPKSQYVAIAQQDAIAAGISPDYFVRQINLESGFNPNAVSPAGAIGIAQFEPGTAAGLGVDPWNPLSALHGAAMLMASYARTYNGDYAKALAAYNGGSGTVSYAVNNCGSNWMNCLPGETRNYIYVIMGI